MMRMFTHSAALDLLELNDYSVSQKSPWGFLTFFPKRLKILVQILHAYYMFLSTFQYKFLFSYLQLWRIYATLSATIQFTPYAQNVHHWPKRTLAFPAISLHSWEFLV